MLVVKFNMYLSRNHHAQGAMSLHPGSQSSPRGVENALSAPVPLLRWRGWRRNERRQQARCVAKGAPRCGAQRVLAGRVRGSVRRGVCRLLASAEWNVGALPLVCPCCVSLTPSADVSLLHRRVLPRGFLSDRARRSGYGGGRGLARTARGEGSRVTGGVVVAVDCFLLIFFFT